MAIRQTFVPSHGMNSQSPAVRHLISTAVGTAARAIGGTTSRRKKKATAASAARRTRGAARTSRKRKSTRAARRSTRTASTRAHLVKGSLAAKRYMAKLRKKRK
jgi:hypothetical protein